MLKNVCAFAIWRGIASKLFVDVIEVASPGEKFLISSANEGIHQANSINPITLKSEWASATRFASLPLFKLARTAVILVPKFEPKSSGIAASSVINPCEPSTIIIPINALLLWISAVNIVPTKMPNSGFSRCNNKSINGWYVLNGYIESDISHIPKKRIPKPKIPSPIFFSFFDFEIKTNANPIPTISRE